jgi:hypothetical protein
MSAIDSFKTGSGTTEPRVYEPSMEEILASIRRIIADDQSLAGRSSQREGEANLRAALDGVQPRQEDHAEGPVPGALSQERPVFLRGTSDNAAVLYRNPAAQALQQAAEAKAELATLAARIAPASAAQGRIAAPQFAMPDTRAPEPQAEAVVSQPAVAEAEAAPMPAPSPEAPQPGAQSAPAAEDAPALFSDVTSKAVAEAFSQLAASRLMENDEILKEIVRDNLRPLLKSWLDDNLPGLVERLVRTEIERVARSAR